jgi:putative RNA 2'-phosphotransferase
MGRRKDPKQLSKLMNYVLGRQPDEFGLAPDKQGFFRMKDLIKAICEEPGWGYVRKSHINEVLITFRDNFFVLEDERIKVDNPDQGAIPVPDVTPPKLLYHCVRRKAYPVVCQKGIMPMGQHHVFLATTEDLARRIGKRRDPTPVLLTVLARRAWEAGVQFYRQGELMFLVDYVPVVYFSGPPLPREKEVEPKGKGERPITSETLPGSFVLDMERSHELHRQKMKRKGVKKEVAWKKDARRLRRERGRK